MDLRERLEQKDSEKLKEIYKNDKNEWPEEDSYWAGEILEERGEELPEQSPPKKKSSTSRSGIRGTGKTPSTIGGYFSFQKLITTGIIRFFYFIRFLGITIASIVAMSQGEGEYISAGILGITVGNIVWRIICENLIVIFDIHDIIASIEEKL
ncbi:MAG: DUF4282 domain-containing protein [Candidatus Bipolaricaulia bacterium]